MNIDCYLSYSHFVIAYHLEDFGARRVSATALVQEIRIQFFFFLRGFFRFSLLGVLSRPTGSLKYKQRVKIHNYILIDVLMCSTAEYFYELKLCRILTSP